MQKVSLIIPFFNEQKILGKNISVINEYCKKHLKKFEIFFVDDGSTDSSRKIVASYIRHLTNLHILSYKKNLGRGEAIRTGFKKANGDTIGYIDCDLEIKLPYILQAVRMLDKSDIVIASKFIPGAVIKTSTLRRLSSILYNVLARIILGSQVTDHQAGLKFFKKNVIKDLLPETHEKGWLWDTEVLYIAQKKNYTIVELPIKISYGYRKMRPSFFLDFLKLPAVLLKLRKNVDKKHNGN